MRKRRQMIAGSFLVGALLLTACSQQPAVNVPDVLQVETVDNGQNRKITVSASETVEVTPDMAEIVYGITTEQEDAEECQKENAKTLNQVLEFLAGQGIADESIKTSGFSMNPRYDWSGSSRELIGYEMCTNITVTDVPVDQVGSLLTKGVEAGANEIESVSYFSSRYDEAYNEALEKAVALAKKKAETLANAGGCRIADICGIEEAYDFQNGRYVDSGLSLASGYSAAKSRMTESADMGVMPGQLQVSASIEAIFLLLPQ